MRSIRYAVGLVWLICSFGFGLTTSVHAQNFGILIQRKKIVLLRKLPPTGHIEGTTVKVVVTATGLQSDLATDLKSTLESVLIRNDSRLRSEDGRADTTINCRITSYAQPQPQMSSQTSKNIGGKPGQNNVQNMERVTGMLTVTFQAVGKSGKSLGADSVTAKYDQEFTASSGQNVATAAVQSVASGVSKITKGGTTETKPPTPIELHNRLIQDAAQQIASHLVNTTEQVDVYLARGGGLDQADKLAESKLWTRALEQLETMKPFPTPEEDAYRLYDLGVVNEALAYQAEDIQKARKYLQEAAVDYGKAIDGKPTEKYFLQPQTRIDTALAHYKIIGDQKFTAAAPAPAPSSSGSTKVSTGGGASPAANADTLTNEEIISMVAAKLDLANIIDTIQHAPSVNFDLTPKGQVDLSKNGVPGTVITAMKTRARSTSTHRTTGKSGL